MPPEKYYYSHTGADFENLKILGLCCVLELPQIWPSTAPLQSLHLQDIRSQNLLSQRYDHAESTTRWIFAYRPNLPAIDTVFVEIDTTSATTHDFTELNNSVVRFLSGSLPQDWNVMVPVAGPTWQGGSAPPDTWPPGFDTLKPVPTPPPTPAPLPPPPTPSGWGSAIIFMGGLLLVAYLFSVRPNLQGGPNPGPIAPQPPAAPMFQPTPFPTKPPCPLGCKNDPVNICPFSVIKGIVTPSNQRLYYEPGHREYGQQSVNPNAGDMWFCTIQEAVGMEFAPAPP